LPFYLSHGVASNAFLKLAGEALEGARVPAPALLIAEKLSDSDPQKQVVVAYKREYEDRFKEDVSGFGGYAYDGIMLLVQAIRLAGSTKTDAVRDALENIKGYVGATGTVNMSAQDHLGLDISAFRLLEVKNGDWAPVK
jgi:branched-chain amino acid transport system substrate-binding protein